jgi:dolichyl-diphosphooligosaccharide--protein glycosyltransferase
MKLLLRSVRAAAGERARRGTYGIVILLSLAIVVRGEDLAEWARNPQLAFHRGLPILTEYDGYYYLRLARDLLEGTYTPEDEKRAVPDGYRRSAPPPLLPWLAARIVRAGWACPAAEGSPV